MGTLAEALQPALVGGIMGPEPAGAQHGRQRQGHHQGDQDGSGQGQGELAEQLLDDAADEENGDEDGHQGNVHRQQGEAHLAGALVGGLERRHAVVDVPGDVFQHHDGIVHHQPRRQDQRHQRQGVEREAEDVHDGEGAHQRDGHRQSRDHRAAQATEEQPDHADHQEDGDDQGQLGFVQGGLDHPRPVHGHFHPGTGRDDGLQRRQARLERSDGLDDVGVGLPVDHQQYRALVVVEAGVVAVLHSVADLGDIAQAQRRAILVADDQRRIVGSLEQLIVGLDLPVVLVIGHRALGSALIGAVDRDTDVVQRQPIVLQLSRLQLDAYRRQGATADLYLADPVGQDRRSKVIELALAQGLGGQGEHHDGCLGRIDLAIARHLAHAAGQQVARGIDGRLHLAGSGVDVLVQIELDDDLGRALAAPAGHGADAGYGAQRALQGRRHAGSHHLRTGTGQRRRYRDGREIHLRQGRDRQ